ncbi:MAG TPA: T9SS type A sorting domain-containing protein [Candidatus Kapabacteria bacterium]
MIKYPILLVIILFVMPLRAQQGPEAALRAYRLRQVQDVFQEKLHLPPGKTIPGLKNEEPDAPLSTVDNPISQSAASEPESEVHAAINPADSANIVIGPIHLQNSMALPIYYTTNFGKSWLKSTFAPAPYETSPSIIGGGDPVFAYDASGKLYMTWIDLYVGTTFDTIYSGMYWAFSTDQGISWHQPTKGYVGSGFELLTGGTLDTSSAIDDKEWIAVDRSTSAYRNSMYVAWTHLGATNVQVMLRRKPPGVDSMLPPVAVSDKNFKRVQYTSLGIDAQGGVHVTFMGTFDTINYGIYTAYSSDGGQTFGPTVKISNADIPGTSPDAAGDLIFGIRPPGNYPCPHLSIDTAVTGNLYEVWDAVGITADENQGTDIYFSRSTDNGQSWNPATIVNNDRDTDFNYTSHFYPTIAVDGKGKISVCWYDRREDPNDQIGRYYIAQSTDQGQTWTNAPVASQPMDFSNVMNVNSNFGIGEYTQVLATPHYTIPVWSDGRDNKGQLRIYAAFLTAESARVEQLSSVSEGLSLSDNYPNPFSTSTNISFNLVSTAHASLYVTNIAGQKIASLYNGLAPSGDHNFMFDGSTLPNGIYYLNLETEIGIVRRAMTVLRP